jgi:hypothetical protein
MTYARARAGAAAIRRSMDVLPMLMTPLPADSQWRRILLQARRSCGAPAAKAIGL